MQVLNPVLASANRVLSAVGVALCVALASSGGTVVYAASTAAHKASEPKASNETQGAQQTQQASAASTPDRFTADDPVKVRDMFASQISTGETHSLTERIRKLAREPYDRFVHGRAATAGNAQRTFLFMIPAPHGILYRSSTHMLSVNVPLASDDDPDVIQLYQSIEGPRGRGLVIAPDAKAKGFIQKIDSIELATAGKKTTARGRLKLPQASFEQADDNFAIVLVCTLEPPYLTETREHSDPTDEEPTDITRRTSTLHANVQAVWLVNKKDNTVLAKGLHLAK
ncbi:hypothetical protein PPMP20_33995 [Paraburkholderia phymatum]|uniref:Uncharacterized protein n=1 Tax=Paraburkholderia phymatum (strain DSM 17167 / CIP 108236 / LMG 21445 / STM815) TaxID=391038 RepID=B2JMN3_PARP8|nr:hypothetical protein [Paraburkholderia phymatum]ACC72827.1 conserved hypothetical protein [Paraburkholderia phymatum STM815]